jgi:hypothetical protein
MQMQWRAMIGLVGSELLAIVSFIIAHASASHLGWSAEPAKESWLQYQLRFK